MSDEPERWRELLGQARFLPDGHAKLALLEEAVRAADSLGDVRAAFGLRQMLMPSAQMAGQPEKILVHFAWCLAQCDRDPEHFDEGELLGRYSGWVTAKMRMTPAVTRAQIESVFEDILRRYRRHGRNVRPVIEERAMTAVYLGDLDRGLADFEESRRLPAERWHGGREHALTEEVLFRFFRGEEGLALEAGGPLLAARGGRFESFIYTYLMMMLARAGRWDEAMRLQVVNYPHLRDKVMYLAEVGHHMELLAVTGHADAAATMFERHLPWLYLTRETFDTFHFSLTAGFVLRRLAAGGQPVRPLRLPKESPAYRGDGRYDVAALAAHFEAGAAGLAARYDARNGNDFFTRRPAGMLARLAATARPVPLPGKNVK